MKQVAFFLMALLMFSCQIEEKYSGDPLEYVPGDAAIILETRNPDLFFSNLRNNHFIKQNKEHPVYQQLQKQLSFLEHFEHNNPAVLSFAKKGERIHYSLIIKGLPEIDSLHDIQQRKVETIKYNNYDIIKYTLDDQVNFVGNVDSLLLISDSEELLIQSLDGDHLLAGNNDLSRTRRATSRKKTNLYIHHDKAQSLLTELLPGAQDFPFQTFSSWTAVDMDITTSGILLNGISTSSNSKKLLNLFEGVDAGPIETPRITPLGSKGFKAVGVRDFHNLLANLKSYKDINKEEEESFSSTPHHLQIDKDSIDQPPIDSSDSSLQEEIRERQIYDSREEELLAGSLEVGLVYHHKANVLVVRPEEILGAQHRFEMGENSESFRGIPIFDYQPRQVFHSLLDPLFTVDDFHFYTVLDHFFLFSNNRSSLEDLIVAYQNQQVLDQSASFTDVNSNLSSSSSLIWVVQNELMIPELAGVVSEEHQKAVSNVEVSEYPLTAVQLVFQNDYAHVHAYLDKTSNGAPSQLDIKQSTSIQLDAPVATKPVFFQNHRSKGLDIAVQDNENTLYLISPEGRIYWKKPLETRILGDIQEVDLLKNGRIQLAFATQNKLHIIDRNGNPVKPFPLEFKDEITQPLGLFDYSKTRDYRFVIVLDKEVHMYDRRGQKVKGFGFTQASTELTQPLKHIRIGSRDYILAEEASGKLNILNRRGEIRVPVKETFELSENPWFEHENKFVSTDQTGNLIRIGEDGTVTKKALDLGADHRIDATSKTFVSLSENKLTIKDKEVTLDFGLYTTPKIFYLNNKLYISVTDLQAQRVYLFDSNAQLLPDFPVFGSSGIDLGNADSDSHLELIVRGDENTILVYQFPGN